MYKTARLDGTDHIITTIPNALGDGPKQRFTIDEFKKIMGPISEAILNILIDQGAPSVDIYC